MAHPQSDGVSVYLARVALPCSEHGEHVLFLSSLEDTAHIMARGIQAHHDRVGLECIVNTFTLPRDIMHTTTTIMEEEPDELPF